MRTTRFFACAGIVAMLVNVLPPAVLAQTPAKPTFTASRNTAPVNTPITFTLKLPASGSQAAPYAFAFGDGATQTVLSAPVYAAAGFAATVSATHAYAKAGTFTARVAASGLGASSDAATYTTTVQITGAPPSASLSPSPSPSPSRPTVPPTIAPSSRPTARPTSPAGSVPSAVPTAASTKPPSPHPTATATVAATTPPNRVTNVVVSPPPGVRASTVRSVTLTWPSGARDLAVAAGAPPPHPVARVDAGQGRYTLQWIVDGALFATVVRDGNGTPQTVELTDPLPVNASGKPHHVEIIVLPQADPFASPPPAQQIAYTVAAAAASAPPYTGPPPAPKQTPFSTAGLHVGVLRLRAPGWGRFEGDSGYKHRTLAGGDAGVPVIDDAVHFAWREMNPGTAETFVVRFFLPGDREIASQRVTSSTFRPDAALLHTLLVAAGTPSGDRHAKRVAAQSSGTTSLANADITWQVEGLHAFAGAPAPIVVERSERWPLAAPIAGTVGQACPAHAPAKAFGGVKSNLSATSKGNVTQLSGTFSFADLPFAPDDVQLNGGAKGRGAAGRHTRMFNNVFVDWGDGAVEPISAQGTGSGSGLRNEVVHVATEHVYAAGGSQEIRVFVLPGDVAERDATNLEQAEKSGFPLYCGIADVTGNDLNVIAARIIASGAPSPGSIKAGGKTVGVASSTVVALATTVPPNCETATQLTADITYTGEGDVDVTWSENGTPLAAQKAHLVPDKYDDAQHPTVLHILSPPLSLSGSSGKQTVVLEVKRPSQVRSDTTSFAPGALPSAVCDLTYPTSGGGTWVIDNVKAGYLDPKTKAEGRISGTGTLHFAIGDLAGNQIDLPTQIAFTNWKVDTATGKVHDGVLHAAPGAAVNGTPQIVQTLHGLAWSVKSADSHLVNDVPDDMHAVVALAPAAGTAKLSANWGDFHGVVDYRGVFTALSADNATPAIDLLNGWSVRGGYFMNVDSGREATSGFCAGYQPLTLAAVMIPDAFMNAVGVSFTPKLAAFGDDGFCAQASTGGVIANLPNGRITVGPFQADLKGGVAHVTDATIVSTLAKPALQTDQRPQPFKYVVDGGASQAAIHGMWQPMLCSQVENCPSTALNGPPIPSQDQQFGSAAFGMSNAAYVAAPDPASGTYVAAIYGDFSERVARYASQGDQQPDLEAFIDFGTTTVGLGSAFISFANNAPYETVTPQTTNVFAKTKIPSTGLSGFVQRDGAKLITQLHGMRPGDNSGDPVTYQWDIDDYATLTGPKIHIPDTEVALPAGQPRVHAVLPTSQAASLGAVSNPASPGFCGAADFSMMTSQEMQGVFYFNPNGSFLVAASIDFGTAAPEVIPGVAVLEGVGGGAGIGLDESVFKGAVSQLGGKNTIESDCSVAFAVRADRVAINAHARVGDASGALWTVDGNLTGAGGGGESFSVALEAGGWLLAHPSKSFGVDEDVSGAPIQAHLKFANDKLTGDVTANVSIPPDVDALTLNGEIQFTFGDGTFDINSPGIMVKVPAFGAVNGTFDFNPNSISAGVALHYGDKVGCCGASADYYFDVAADATIQRSPLHMVLDASVDVGGDLCLFVCGGLSAGGGIRIEAPNPTHAAIRLDLPDPIGSVSVNLI